MTTSRAGPLVHHSVGEAQLQRGDGQLPPLPDLAGPDRLAVDIVCDFQNYAIASGIMENFILKIRIDQLPAVKFFVSFV